MSDFDNMQDQIEKYIGGMMSDDEKKQFEDKLCSDDVLQHEVKIESTISDAVQAVHLKRMMQGIESQRKVRLLFSQWIGVAASLAVLFLGGYVFYQTNRIKSYGNDCYAAILRSSEGHVNAVDSVLLACHQQIGNKQYTEASSSLSKVNDLIKEADIKSSMQTMGSNSLTAEELRYNNQQKQYEADWYGVIILMKQGKYRRVKTVLQGIAFSDSPYSAEAKSILNQMYHTNY